MPQILPISPQQSGSAVPHSSMRVAFGQSALMEIDCPLFRCLSHWVMKWRRGQPLEQFLLSPLPSSCPTAHFASHCLSTDIDWDKYLYKFRCRAVYPYSINYWRFIVRVEHSLGRSPSTLLPHLYSVSVYSAIYIYLSISKYTAYIQIVSYWKLFDELTSAL